MAWIDMSKSGNNYADLASGAEFVNKVHALCDFSRFLSSSLLGWKPLPEADECWRFWLLNNLSPSFWAQDTITNMIFSAEQFHLQQKWNYKWNTFHVHVTRPFLIPLYIQCGNMEKKHMANNAGYQMYRFWLKHVLRTGKERMVIYGKS